MKLSFPSLIYAQIVDVAEELICSVLVVINGCAGVTRKIVFSANKSCVKNATEKICAAL